MATPSDKNQIYPLWGACFYYAEGVRAHLDRAHKDTRDITSKCDKSAKSAVTGSNADTAGKPLFGVKGINNNDPVATAMGTNTKNVTLGNVIEADATSATLTTQENHCNSAVTVSDEPSTSTSTIAGVKPKTKFPGTLKELTGYHNRRPKPYGKHLPVSDNTDENAKPVKSKSKLKSEFVTVMHGIRCIKPVWHYKCKICQYVTDSQVEVNKHYQRNHLPVKCPDCDQTFNNPSTLRRHKYNHYELKYPCCSCGCKFAFESDLTNHHLKHRRHPGHQCNHEFNWKVCGKWFVAKGDLTKHAKIHSGIVYSCTKCAYTTIDHRYLSSHQYTHSNIERYHCGKCGRKFKHHTQLDTRKNAKVQYLMFLA